MIDNSALTQLENITNTYVLPGLVDSIFDGSPLLKRWRSRGMIRGRDPIRDAVPGTQFEWRVRYAKISAKGTTSPRAVVPTAPTNTTKRASLAWGMYFAGYSIDQGEQDANKTPAAIANMMKEKIDEAKDALIDIMGDGLHADGSDTDGIVGLPQAVSNYSTYAAEAVSATYGNITRDSGISFWNANVLRNTSNYNYANLCSSGSTVSYTLPYLMKQMWGLCNQHRAHGTPTIIVTSQAFADAYEDWALSKGSLQMSSKDGPNMLGIGRADPQTVDLGFEPFTYKQAPILVDPHCPTNKMYFLNEDRVFLQPTGSNELRTTPLKESPNQIGVKVAQFFWRGQMALTEPRTCGVIIGDPSTLSW